MDDLLLDDEMSKEHNYVPASKGKRFANFIIDQILIFVLAAVITIAIGIVSPDIVTEMADMSWLEERLFGVLSVLIYYPITEGLLKGKSLAKYFTKTRAINYDGTPPTFGTCFMRSLSRIVPFEPFSFLGELNNGWHDKWTETMVIDEKQSSY